MKKDNELGEGAIIVELDRALYGRLQSARRWCDALKEALENMDYEPSKRDPCVLRKYNNEGKVIALYVVSFSYQVEQKSQMRTIGKN